MATHETVDRCLKNTVGRRIAVQVTVHQLTPREVLRKALSKNEPLKTSKDVANIRENSAWMIQTIFLPWFAQQASPVESLRHVRRNVLISYGNDNDNFNGSAVI